MPKQPTMRTEKDIGSENPETTTVSGFFRVIFQGATQKISFPLKNLQGGLEIKFIIQYNFSVIISVLLPYLRKQGLYEQNKLLDLAFW